ncbi:MAG: hypothetical protein IKE85_06280 [Mogibacterium sp.]|nr:hypothetical protein [Mogibacterium sp.]
MKAMKNRSLLVVALVLVLTLSVGLTLAYFSDLSVAKGGKTIALKGSTEIEEEQPSNNKKIVRIVNTGDTPVMVRVAVYAPGEGATGSGSDWEKSGDYFYYKKVIPAKAGDASKSSPLEVTWKVPADLGDDYSVVVAQESEMVVYDKDGNVVKPETDPAWAVLPAAQ